MAIKTLLVISDMQCGSRFAIWPESFKDYGWGKVQEYLSDCWKDMLKRIPKKIDYLILNGDLIDGYQPIQKGTEAFTTDVGVQADAVLELLKPLQSRTEKIYVTKGTEYHDLTGGLIDDIIGKNLGAEKFADGHHSTWILTLNIDDVIVESAHHGYRSQLYYGSALGKDLMFNVLSSKEGKFPRADLVLRGHNQYFYHVEDVKGHAVNCPAWQIQTPYGIKKGANRLISDIGLVYFFLDGETKRRGDDPITMKKLIYQHPAREVKKA